MAECLQLRLVRQIGNHRLIGFQTTQDVGTDEFTQRPEVPCLGEAPRVLRKCLTRTQQPRVREIEDRPEVRETVLDRRSGKCHAGLGDKLLDRTGLLGARILDGLCLIDDRHLPARTRQPVIAQ